MASVSDIETVTALLGREPQGEFEVVLRRVDSTPVVIKNQPILFSGRPMPTLYWLVDSGLLKSVGRLESTGAIDGVEEEIGLEEIAGIHDRYRQERERLLAELDVSPDAPRPSGGVGGTRTGVKCLHAHLAYHLAGGKPVVGAWVEAKLLEMGEPFDPAEPGLLTELANDS